MDAAHRAPTLGARRAAAVVAALVVALAGCRPATCDGVPTTADGCRELCHDRGAEMSFFRYAPDTYRCDATCVCTP